MKIKHVLTLCAALGSPALACQFPMDAWTSGVVFNDENGLKSSTLDTLCAHVSCLLDASAVQARYPSLAGSSVMVVLEKYEDSYNTSAFPRLLIITDSSQVADNLNYTEVLVDELERLATILGAGSFAATLPAGTLRTAFSGADSLGKGSLYWTAAHRLTSSAFFLYAGSCSDGYCEEAWDDCGVDIEFAQLQALASLRSEPPLSLIRQERSYNVQGKRDHTDKRHILRFFY